MEIYRKGLNILIGNKLYFIQFKDLRLIEFPERIDGRYATTIYSHKKIINESNHVNLMDDDEESSIKTYNKIIKAWTDYNSEKPLEVVIKETFQQFLLHVQLMPGSEESEKAKDEFLQNTK